MTKTECEETAYPMSSGMVRIAAVASAYNPLEKFDILVNQTLLRSF